MLSGDAIDNCLFGEPSEADPMRAAEMAQRKAPTRVKDLLGARVVLPDEVSSPLLEDRIPQVKAKKAFGP